MSESRSLDSLYNFMEMENMSQALRRADVGYVPINAPALTAVTAAAVAAASYGLLYLLSPSFQAKANKVRNKVAAFIAVPADSV